MYTFIVLGYVPGTNLQITFRTWIVLSGLAGIAYSLHKMAVLHRHLMADGMQLRLPLHASRLHLRG